MLRRGRAVPAATPTGATRCCSTSTSTATPGAGSGRRTRPAGPGSSPTSSVRLLRVPQREPHRIRPAGPGEPLRGRPHREWLVTDGLGGYAMGTVGGPAHPPLPRAARRRHRRRRSARRWRSPRSTPWSCCGDRRIRLATHEWADGSIAPAGYVHLASFELEDGVPRWRWTLGDVVLEREVAMAHGRPPRRRSCTALRARRRARCGWSWRRCAPGATSTASASARSDPAVEPRPTASSFEGPTACAGPASSPAATWYRGRAAPRGGRPRARTTARTSGSPAGSSADLRAGDESRVVGLGRRPRRRRRPRPRDVVAAARARRAGDGRAPCRAGRRRRPRCWRWPPTSSCRRRARRWSPATRGSATGRATR